MIRLPTSLVIACLLIVAPALALAPALADDDCAVPMSEWQPRDAVMQLAETKGWAVSRIRLDDGLLRGDRPGCRWALDRGEARSGHPVRSSRWSSKVTVMAVAAMTKRRLITGSRPDLRWRDQR